MKYSWLAAVVAGLALAGGPAGAQQPDYLTPEEVEKVRETQEPNQRVTLFLGFAGERLIAFEKALAGMPDREPTPSDDLKDSLNNFIRAVDDAAEALDTALARGGVDLRKTRAPLTKSTTEFLARLEQVQKTDRGASEELRYDLEDAVEATQELAALGKQIPDAPIPPKGPAAGAQEATKEKEPPPPGRPTLKRKKDNKPR